MAQPTFHPLTPARWPDLVRLFGARGACGGCWCMWWRLTRGEFERRKGAGNRRAFRKLVAAGPPPGVLAYVDGEVVGWCAVGPREAFPALERSRVLARVDDRPVWSVVCFFVAAPYRSLGLSTALLRQAVRFAERHGARIVEGYPIDAGTDRYPAAFAWVGLLPSFEAAGFVEVTRRSSKRPIVRFPAPRAPRAAQKKR